MNGNPTMNVLLDKNNSKLKNNIEAYLKEFVKDYIIINKKNISI